MNSITIIYKFSLSIIEKVIEYIKAIYYNWVNNQDTSLQVFDLAQDIDQTDANIYKI